MGSTREPEVDGVQSEGLMLDGGRRLSCNGGCLGGGRSRLTISSGLERRATCGGSERPGWGVRCGSWEEEGK